MEILLTDGAGFIGSAVVRQLLKHTDFCVVNVDKLTYAGHLDSLAMILSSQRYTHEQVDICDALHIRDWLYVEDHAQALIKVVTKGKIGETYTIGGHNEKTNLELVEKICQILEELAPKKPAGITYYRDLITFVKDRPGHDTRYATDASKMKRELGWIPKETFETGLHKTIHWYLDNRQCWERVLSGSYRLERLGG